MERSDSTHGAKRPYSGGAGGVDAPRRFTFASSFEIPKTPEFWGALAPELIGSMFHMFKEL